MAEQGGGQWAHDIAAQYRDLAAGETWEPRRVALEAEAAKYDGIARRMDRVLAPTAVPSEEGPNG